MVWTSEMDALLRELYPSNTNREISASTGWSYYHIGKRAAALDLHKAPDARSRAAGKTQWTDEMDDFLRNNFHRMTNPQLADSLGLTITLTRTRLYELGMKRMELEYWTEEQIHFLKENYRQTGDLELAEIFASRWPKAKGWSKKHIEKKRRYLKLKRTTVERKFVRRRNEQAGRWGEAHQKRWDKQGRAPEGEVRYWRKSNAAGEFPVIKVDGRWLHWGPWRWEQMHGPVPDGSNVIFKDGNSRNRADDNLMLVTDGELSARNSLKSSIGLSDNYVAGVLTHGRPDLREAVKQQPQLLELKRQQLIYQRTINKKIDDTNAD